MKDPAILFYTSDFLTGTAFFTDEQRGQYIRLLCEQHQNGHIPENHMVSICFSLASPVVKKFVKDSDGNYYNERMEEEIEKRRHFLDTRYFNGKKGGRPRKPNSKPNNKPTENLREDDNENEIDYENIVGLYHELCPKMQKVLVLNKTRKGHINARFAEFGLSKITEVLRLAGESDFLNGKNDRTWKADFEWLMRPENFIKVLEGKYQNKTVEKQLAI
ncbi:MAG: YdaU family protein [Clostridiaceae bacterium]|jgi:uncharacterized protein YdaU (DUF1376 family)|nr:YdaU family protein [Clostridiaceae bacterium]